MNLTGRLKLVARKVPPCGMLCDVGTDHGYVPIYLAQKGICMRAIAADAKRGPLLSAQRNIILYGLEDRIETRLGSGLNVLKPYEAQAVVMAGMGGELIARLLEESLEVARTVETFVLQPMNSINILRKWLYQNDFPILNEELEAEGEKIYNVLVAAPDKTERTERNSCPVKASVSQVALFEIGKYLIENKDPLLARLLEKKICEARKVMAELKDMETEQALKAKIVQIDKLEAYQSILDGLKEE